MILRTRCGTTWRGFIWTSGRGASTSKLAQARDASHQGWLLGCNSFQIETHTHFQEVLIKVVKASNNTVQLLHKAFNGRIICAYMAETSSLASAKQLKAPGSGRIYGQWLQEQIWNGRRVYLADPKLPLQAACLFPGLARHGDWVWARRFWFNFILLYAYVANALAKVSWASLFQP